MSRALLMHLLRWASLGAMVAAFILCIMAMLAGNVVIAVASGICVPVNAMSAEFYRRAAR